MSINFFMSFKFLRKLYLERLKSKKNISLGLQFELTKSYRFWKRNKEQLKLGSVNAVFTDVYYGPVRLQTQVSFETRVKLRSTSNVVTTSLNTSRLPKNSWTFTQTIITLVLSLLTIYFSLLLGYAWYLDLINYNQNLSVTRYGLVYILNTALTGARGQQLSLGAWVDTLVEILVSMKILC